MNSEYWDSISAEARKRPPLRALEGRNSPRLNHLANCCAVLEAKWGERGFLLSSPVAATLCGVSASMAAKYLEILRKEGILTRLQMGTKGKGGKATLWRFNGDRPLRPNNA